MQLHYTSKPQRISKESISFERFLTHDDRII